MTDAKDNSSLPVLLAITGAVVVVGIGGWFFLEQDSKSARATQELSAESFVADPAAETATGAPVETSTGESGEATVPIDASEVDAALRKARLAADADILLYPDSQSAFHYYGQILDIEPNHEIASAELDALLAKVAQTVTTHLERKEFDEAYRIAMKVATRRPEHSLVADTQQTLDREADRLVETAIEAAQNGDDDGANELVAAAKALPGRSPEYLAAILDSINEIRDVRLAAERDRQKRALLAADDAKQSWIDGVRNAIAAGQLIAPAGASARDLLAEDNDWRDERQTLSAELLAAMKASVQAHIDAQEFDKAEKLLFAAEDFGGKSESLDQLRNTLDTEYVEYRSEQPIDSAKLVGIKLGPPRYPARALQRGQDGWVEVHFVVTPEGDTADIEVSASEPESIFDRVAISAVEKWKFAPVKIRDRLVSQRAVTRLVFQVQE